MTEQVTKFTEEVFKTDEQEIMLDLNGNPNSTVFDKALKEANPYFSTSYGSVQVLFLLYFSGYAYHSTHMSISNLD